MTTKPGRPKVYTVQATAQIAPDMVKRAAALCPLATGASLLTWIQFCKKNEIGGLKKLIPNVLEGYEPKFR